MWEKRLLACVAGCKTFAERTPSVASGAVWTKAAAREAVSQVAGNVPVDRVRRRFGVGWHTVMRAVTAAADAIVPVPPTRVGIDETVMISGRLLTRRREYLTSLVCLTTGLVVAVAQGRNRAVAADLLADHAPDAEVIAVDLFSGYLAAANAVDGATVVADVFHLVRLGLQAMDKVRRRRQRQIHGRRARKGDPLFRLQRVLRVAQERLDAATCEWIHQQVLAADPQAEVCAAWIAVDLLRNIYTAPNRKAAHRRLIDFYWWIVAVDIDELTTLATTIDTWTDEILAYFDTLATNAATESANVKIKDIRRAARGFRNPDNYAARIMLHAGQPRTVPTTPKLRTRT